jgi:hypothetical protein
MREHLESEFYADDERHGAGPLVGMLIVIGCVIGSWSFLIWMAYLWWQA